MARTWGSAPQSFTKYWMISRWPSWQARYRGVAPVLVWALSVLQAEHSAGCLQPLRWEHSGHRDTWGTGVVWPQSTGVWDSQLWGHRGSVRGRVVTEDV